MHAQARTLSSKSVYFEYKKTNCKELCTIGEFVYYIGRQEVKVYILDIKRKTVKKLILYRENFVL